MPSSSSQLRAIQHDIELVINNSWIDDIGLYSREAESACDIEQAPLIPIDLSGSIQTLIVYHPVTKEVLLTLDNSSPDSALRVSDSGPEYFKIYLFTVDLPAGKYRYHFTLEFPGVERYDYLVGTLTVKTP